MVNSAAWPLSSLVLVRGRTGHSQVQLCREVQGVGIISVPERIGKHDHPTNRVPVLRKGQSHRYPAPLRRQCSPHRQPSRRVAVGIVGDMGNNGRHPMSDLTERLDDIERRLDDGTYLPGPWAGFLRDAGQRDRAERKSLTEDVSRISDKLNRRKHPVTVPLRVGLLIELAAMAVGLIVLELGLRRPCPGCVLVAAAILTVTWQPLLKVATGYLMGVRYSYLYMSGVEPRIKMQYGTYLAASRWRRVALHLVRHSGVAAGVLVGGRPSKERPPGGRRDLLAGVLDSCGSSDCLVCRGASWCAARGPAWGRPSLERRKHRPRATAHSDLLSSRR